MKKPFLLFILFHCFWLVPAQEVPQQKPPFVLVIHGGAGAISRQYLSIEKEKAYKAALHDALLAGYNLLNRGGSALDAVEAAVRLMEDHPLFNAGRGAVRNNEGHVELDASIMNGKNLMAGAVAAVTTIKNPVSAARAVMEKSPHVLLVGKGAEQFAAQHGLETVKPDYFETEDRRKEGVKVRQEDSLKNSKDTAYKMSRPGRPENRSSKYGTVGAVALDQQGNLAAATSTGGMSNKWLGRIGDSPIIGAGTYADNTTCAISCTGWGEFFMRLVVAKSVSDLMEYKQYTVQQAADEIIKKKLPQSGGDGGLIAVDKHGNITMPFTTQGMFRGYIKTDGKAVVNLYGP